MIELQVLSRVLKQKNTSILTLNGITEDYFISYPEEFKFIEQHKDKYGNIPDPETFMAKFPNFSLVDVAESDKYLVDTFHEEHLYALTVPVITKIAELLQTDSTAAIEYLISQVPYLTPKTSIIGKDIISTANERLEEWIDKRENHAKYFITTGFEELDDITGGLQRGEELAVIVSRTGQGKTWILLKILQHAWKLGLVAGLLEPEMTSNKMGYRFDTLNANLSNRSLLRGEEVAKYEEYIEELKKGANPLFVAHPRDFNKKVTISKLRAWVQSNNIQILGIDGISYLTDERYQRGDNKSTQLTNISEDLMDLSIELKIPIIVVVQSNREGVKDDAPDVENIRDSDGIAFNASTIIATKQKGPGVELSIRKNRNGSMGSLLYYWDIDNGIFRYIPSDEYDDESAVESTRNSYQDGGEVF